MTKKTINLIKYLKSIHIQPYVIFTELPITFDEIIKEGIVEGDFWWLYRDKNEKMELIPGELYIIN